ncbi:AAA family ATPase [Aeromonas dhakensis]|uniref:AAA family ATPase n=1 Tax=Aeromonas dhakensis TaxID=196024 RepID=UPI003B9EDCCA
MKFSGNNKFTYIIGNNGSGKSRALEENAELLSENRNVVVIASGVSDKFKFRAQVKKTTNGSYRYFGNRTVGNGTHNGTLAANAVLLFLAVLDKELCPAFMRFLEEIGFDGRFGVCYRKTKFSKISPFETQELTSEFSALNQEILTAKEKPFEAVFYKSGTSYPFSDLSSGEQYIITTALKILTSIIDEACYFIDEPEVSLHVEWQVRWPELFHPLLSLKDGVNSFIATHSPVIISSALQAGAECYSLANGELLKILEHEFNVERILYKNFNTLPPNNKYLFEELATIVTKTIDSLTGVNSAGTNYNRAEASALASVEEFKKKLQNASHTEKDNEDVQRTLEDFDMAIRDLIAMSKHSGVQTAPQMEAE